jgi:hypothetical protein
VTGLNNVRVEATGGNGYATATNYALVLTAGTVDSVSVAGYVVGHFSIENRSALMPTTAARTLDVSADGDAEANVTKWLGTAAATPTVAGVPEVDVTHWIGTAAATPTTAGVPEVDVTFYAGVAATSIDDPLVMLDTTVSSVTSQTVLVLTAGAPESGAYPAGSPVQITDAVTAAQKCVGFVLTYVVSGGGTVFTLTLDADPGVFTIATGDKVKVLTKTQSRTESAAGVWGALRAAYTTTGTFGAGVIVNAINNDAISSGSFSPGALTAAATASSFFDQIQVEANDALVANRLDELLAADSDIDGAAPPTVGSVFHELMSKTAGSFTFDQTTDSLEAVRDRGDAAWVTATGFSTHSAADVWAVGTRTITSLDEDSVTLDLDATVRAAVGLASANLDTQLSAIDDYLDTEVAAILAAVDTEVAAIKTVTDQFAAAQAEPTAAPAANATPLEKLAWIAALARNKITQTATTQTVFRDDGSTTMATSTVSDDATTFTRGEFS